MPSSGALCGAWPSACAVCLSSWWSWPPVCCLHSLLGLPLLIFSCPCLAIISISSLQKHPRLVPGFSANLPSFCLCWGYDLCFSSSKFSCLFPLWLYWPHLPKLYLPGSFWSSHHVAKSALSLLGFLRIMTLLTTLDFFFSNKLFSDANLRCCLSRPLEESSLSLIFSLFSFARIPLGKVYSV